MNKSAAIHEIYTQNSTTQQVDIRSSCPTVKPILANRCRKRADLVFHSATRHEENACRADTIGRDPPLDHGQRSHGHGKKLEDFRFEGGYRLGIAHAELSLDINVLPSIAKP
jgi:hypothetical protein